MCRSKGDSPRTRQRPQSLTRRHLRAFAVSSVQQTADGVLPAVSRVLGLAEADLGADSLIGLIERFESGRFASRDVLAVLVAGLVRPSDGTVDPGGDIGLHLGEAMKPRLLDVVGYLLLSARDLEEALRSFVRFQHILSGGFAARLEVEGETARLILDINYLGYASLRQQIECLMLLFLKLLALISDDEFVAERIEFRHRAPPRLGEHRRLFGRLPLFSRPHDALVFSAALLRRPSRNANPDMHDVLTRHAEEQSRELSENRLLNRVRYLIELRLGEGYGLRQCAAELGLGSGALQRALAAGGASFRQVRDEVRRQRASEMLLAGRAIREVAKACGFAELSPFYRAFRRWHAAPPEQYRARLAKREEGYSTSGT